MHKYAGLTLGLVLSITGISGSLIVFDRELDEIIDPATARFEAADYQGSLDVALRNAALTVNNGSKPTRIVLGRNGAAPHIIRFPIADGDAGHTEVTVDPGSGQVTSVRVWGEYPVTWMYRLHYSLLAGDGGETAVGIIGIVLLFFCLSGIAIWWPVNGFNSIRHVVLAFRVRVKGSAVAINYDLHKLLGILSFPLLAAIAFTGIEMVWHEPVEGLVASVATVVEEPSPQSTIGAGQVTVNQVYDQALTVYPAAKVSRIYFPSSATAPYRVSMIQAEEVWQEYGATQVWVDQYSGAVLDTWDSRALPAGNNFLQWMFPLHNGEGLGMLGRVLVFFAGLLPSFFFISGFYLWFRRQRKAGRKAVI
jgi:uncharacterized iron-regulated membrane protein